MEEAIGFGDEGGGEEAIVVDGGHAVGGGDAGAGRDVPAQLALEAAAGRQIVGAVRGLGPEPPAVGIFLFGVVCPIFETAGLDQGQEGGAEGGFGGGAEFEGGDLAGAEAGGEPAGQPFADAAGVADEVVDAPMLEVGQEALGERRPSGMALEMARAVVGEDVQGAVKRAFVRPALVEGDDGARRVIAGGVVELGEGAGGGFVLAADVEQGDDGRAVWPALAGDGRRA